MEYYREIKKLSHDNMDESNKTKMTKKIYNKKDGWQVNRGSTVQPLLETVL